MASILDRYGIKEVADVTFYHIDEGGNPDYPVLYLDTLKVSTIEQTASDVSAQGGKGNPKLITWDYGKEINVTITDALFSPKSMNLMFGGANAQISEQKDKVTRSINYQVQAADQSTLPGYAVLNKDGSLTVTADSTADTSLNYLPVTWFDDLGNTVGSETTIEQYDRFIGTVEITPTLKENRITIDAAHFPGTYYIVGDTYARNDVSGEDEFFQFIIFKAKVTAENSITLEAEGDPSTFNLNLTVLRNQDGKMMELVQYNP